MNEETIKMKRINQCREQGGGRAVTGEKPSGGSMATQHIITQESQVTSRSTKMNQETIKMKGINQCREEGGGGAVTGEKPSINNYGIHSNHKYYTFRVEFFLVVHKTFESAFKNLTSDR